MNEGASHWVLIPGIIVPADCQLINVSGDLGGLVPTSTAKPTVKTAEVS